MAVVRLGARDTRSSHLLNQHQLTLSADTAEQIMMMTVAILCKPVGKSNNNPPCFHHRRGSNLQPDGPEPSRLCCANHWAHTCCLPCVFTTHSPNYSGSKQLNNMLEPTASAVRVDYAALQMVGALHTPSLRRPHPFTRGLRAPCRRKRQQEELSPGIIARAAA